MNEKAPTNLRTRLNRVAHFITDHIRHAPDSMSDHYRPSIQRDVGKTAAQAADVSLIVDGINVKQAQLELFGRLNAPDDQP